MMNSMQGYGMPYDGKSIPYSIGYMDGDYLGQISSICSELGDSVKFTLNGITVDDIRVPTLPKPAIGQTYNPGKASQQARAFKEKINTLREEENEEAFPDGTYIIELMEVQMMIDLIKNAKRESERVPAAGKVFSFCHISNSHMEIEEGNFLAFCQIPENSYCVELEPGFLLDKDCNIVDNPYYGELPPFQTPGIMPGMMYEGDGDIPEPSYDDGDFIPEDE